MRADGISIPEARRLALAAQGFDRPRPARVGERRLANVIYRMGLLQLDFVNVLTPSHYLVPFSRLGAYDRSHLDALVYDRGEFTEAWAHEASIVPMHTWPLLRHRRETHIARPWGFDQIMARHRDYADAAVEEIRRRGPLGAIDLPDPSHTARRMPGTWYGNVPRAVLEACFGRGQLAVTMRRDNFSRVYDLVERVIPGEHLDRAVDRHDGQRELLMVAAHACGVGTAADLADYFRMKVSEARPRIAELVDGGRLAMIRVDGWREPAYILPDAAAPRAIRARALLSPFDPLIWFRPRTARLFEFDYRFEIFVPGHKRKWGSYVLPFLFGDRLAARVDLKADRRNGRLLASGAFLESWANAGLVAEALALELRTLATWLGVEVVRVGRRGNLAAALTAAVRSQTTRVPVPSNRSVARRCANH